MARQYNQRNNVNLDGQLTNDVQIFGDEMKVARFTIASNRYIGDNAPETVQTADYIPCKLFGKNIGWMGKFKKGTPVTIEEKLESGSYSDSEGKKVYEVYVNVSRILPLERKQNSNETEFSDIPEGFDDTPFR